MTGNDLSADELIDGVWQQTGQRTEAVSFSPRHAERAEQAKQREDAAHVPPAL